MRQVRFVQLYRFIARVLPLKYRLNFMIDSYLASEEAISIPYYDRYDICITPNSGNTRTISDLVFEGWHYLPEFRLVNRIKSDLGKRFVYVDIGSNIGTTVWLFANAAERIYAFEPIPHLYETIRNSIQNNNAGNIKLVNKALGAGVGSVRMLNNNNSSVVSDAAQDSVEIPVSTLDIELESEKRIDLLKIDVEGFEMKVLEGAKEVIQSRRPRILLELHPGYIKNYGSDVASVIDFLEARGYKITYYSFLHNLRLTRMGQLLKRFQNGSQKIFRHKQDFLDDLNLKPELSSYHLYCEPQHS
jgi:FkbM family methyltransferase